MKQKSRACLAAICSVTAAMVGAVAAPMVGAYEATPTNDEPTAVSSETVSQYNLASENWNELLGVSSDGTVSSVTTEITSDVTSEDTASVAGSFWHGNKKSDGGLSKLLIIAIIAFALGAVGVTFFIYSQFIYKAKLRRKMAESNESTFVPTDDDFSTENLTVEEPAPQPTLPEQPKPKQDTTQKKVDFFDDLEKQIQLPATQEIKKLPQTPTLSEEDEKKLNAVDWDNFFNNDKNTKKE